jgi:hypothetical protein
MIKRARNLRTLHSMQRYHKFGMHLNSNKITHLLASRGERQDATKIKITTRDALQFLLADWGFVQGLTMKTRSPLKKPDEAIRGVHTRLLEAGVSNSDETAKLIALMNAAQEEGIRDMSITITKNAALHLGGNLFAEIVPGGAQLRFAAELSGNITLSVSFS